MHGFQRHDAVPVAVGVLDFILVTEFHDSVAAPKARNKLQ